MASLDQLKQTFFEECNEALQQIEAGLTEIRAGHPSDDTVNAVFRAVHSVKGGAGIFGFEALVEFAHVFETLLDGVRRGSLTATPETIDVLLSASDVLSDLVQMSRGGEAVPSGFGSECRTALEHIIEQDSKGAAARTTTRRRRPILRESISHRFPLISRRFPRKRTLRMSCGLTRLPSGRSRKC